VRSNPRALGVDAVAELCARSAGDLRVPLDVRVTLGMASDKLRDSARRLERQALHLERAEAAVHPHWPLLEPEDDPGLGL
jgi:hypothetical protein